MWAVEEEQVSFADAAAKISQKQQVCLEAASVSRKQQVCHGSSTCVTEAASVHLVTATVCLASCSVLQLLAQRGSMCDVVAMCLASRCSGDSLVFHLLLLYLPQQATETPPPLCPRSPSDDSNLCQKSPCV